MFLIALLALALPVAHGREYFLSANVLNFNEAEGYCRNKFGNANGLAVIRDQTELSDLKAFLGANAMLKNYYWIDGAYDQQQQKFYWSRLLKPDGTRLYFEDFVKSLFKTDIPQPNGMIRTTIVMQDKATAKLGTSNWSQLSKFVCQRG